MSPKHAQLDDTRREVGDDDAVDDAVDDDAIDRAVEDVLDAYAEPLARLTT